MSRPKYVHCPPEKAEGDIHYPGAEKPVPYNTFLAGPNGSHIHFWLDYPYHGEKLAKKLKAFATHFRDIVSCSYSGGEPSGYWAHQDMRPS